MCFPHSVSHLLSLRVWDGNIVHSLAFLIFCHEVYVDHRAL